MRVFRWILGSFAIVLVVVALAIAIGVAWLNTYIHSDAFKAEIESRASQSLGGTVQIGQVDFNIFSGVKLQTLVTQIEPEHAGGQGALEVKVANVNCTYAWKELLSRRLKLTGMTLDQPQIILTRQPVAPLPAPPETSVPAPEPATTSTPAPSAATASGQPTASTPSAPASTDTSTAMPFQFILDQAKINNGAVSVLDANGTAMVNLEGVDVDADTAGYTEGKSITGTLKIADIVVPSKMHITSFSSPFTYDDKTGLAASPFEASAYGGNIAGDYSPQPTGPTILNLNGKGFDVAQLTAATTSDSSAKLTGSLDFQSKWRGVEIGDLNGEGDAQITDGKLEGVKILQDIGQILKIKELNEPVIKKGQTHFLVQNRQTQLTGLEIESSVFSLTGDGTISFDGPLNLNMVLILHREAMQKLPKELAASFVGQQDGTGSIGFHVTGTTANPQTDLPERLLLQNTQIQNVLEKAINKFFH
jgi:uncharacterized protein involved in outer membrane biogenesis